MIIYEQTMHALLFNQAICFLIMFITSIIRKVDLLVEMIKLLHYWISELGYCGSCELISIYDWQTYTLFVQLQAYKKVKVLS